MYVIAWVHLIKFEIVFACGLLLVYLLEVTSGFAQKTI